MPKAPLVRLSSLIFDSPLAILPEKLETILHAIGPRLNADQAAIRELTEAHLFHERRAPRASWDDDEDDYDSPSQQKKPYAQTDAGVAIIPVKGVLMKEGGWMSALSGCSSYASIKKATIAAMDDPTVRAVMFNVDSPGGTTHGCFELSDLIHSYRGKKPTLAIANDLAASAAYAIASASDRVLLTRTAGVGSVGVFCLHLDQSAADAQAGVKYTYIYAGDHKVDGNPHEALSKTAKSSVQAEVDREYAIFVSTVARNRGVKDSAILGTQAEVLFEPAAIPLLADAVGTYDSALADLTSMVLGNSVRISFSSTSTSSDVDKMAKAAEAKTITVDGITYTANVYVSEPEGINPPSPAGTISTPVEVVAPSAAAPDPRKEGEPGEPEPDDDPDDMNCDDDATASSASESCDNPNHPVGCNHSQSEDYEDKKAISMATEQTAPPAPPSAPSFSVEDATMILGLCNIAGQPMLAAKYVESKTPVATVIKELNDLRSTESAKTTVNSSFGAVSTDSIDSLISQTDALVANSGGTMLKSRALESILRRNPAAYDAYENERVTAALTPEGTRKYVYAAASRMAALGLSPVIGS